jgi:acyl-coenzyme A thioesterase 9
MKFLHFLNLSTIHCNANGIILLSLPRMISSTRNSLIGARVFLHRCQPRAQQRELGICLRLFSSSSTDAAVNYTSDFKIKGPIVAQLWTARLEAKQKAATETIDMDRPRSPSESVTKFTYNFKEDGFLAERYRNPFGHLRFGKVLEDLDALAGNIAFGHVQDPSVNIVTASVDKIKLSGLPDLENNQHMSGKVTYVGTSSMEIRMQCKCDGVDEDPWMEAYFTFVAVNRETKRPMVIPPLEPQTWLEKDQFEAGERRAQQRKEARKKSKNFETAHDSEVEKLALKLLQESGPLKNIPGLADPNSILMEQTKLQNCELAQPQTANLANQIFGGFLMRRAFDLAYATAYVFAGCRPRFMEVDEVAFTIPVSVGDLTNFQAQVIYADVHDEVRGFNIYHGQKNIPLVSIEVYAWVVEPEQASAKLSNKFTYTFAVDSGTNIRKVLPANMEDARKMAIQVGNRRTV